MKVKEFFGKFGSAFLWGNLLAMLIVIVLLALGVKYGLDWYTHHGEGVRIPKVEGMDYGKARSLLEAHGLNIMVSDSGYNKAMAANSVLIQNPGAGTTVKLGHTVYVTVNSPSSPSFAIPDIVDNSSFREAEAKLTSLGFKLTPPQEVAGEKDWVYGIISRGRRVGTGDRVTTDAPLTLIVGSGGYEDENVSFSDDYGDEPVDAGSAVIEEEIVVPELDGVMGTNEIEKE